MDSAELNDRERSILRHVVFNYIVTAIPVGSRFISKKFEKQLSPATIRNTMADLEEMGFLSHPHTSAGRVPTDFGYRYYVDFLMDAQALTDQEKNEIAQALERAADQEEMLRESSKILGKISRQLSVVSAPQLASGTFERLELVPMGGARLLVVISIRTGIVRTVMLEVQSDIRRQTLERLTQTLNERLSGLTLQQIRDSFRERVRDMEDADTGLVRLFIESVDQLFDDSRDREKVHISGTQNIIEQPEFLDPKNFRGVIELIENQEFIVHLLERPQEQGRETTVTIGSENPENLARNYSLVTAMYDAEGMSGKLGILGPRRMDYSKVIPLVEHVAHTMARLLRGG